MMRTRWIAGLVTLTALTLLGCGSAPPVAPPELSVDLPGQFDATETPGAVTAWWESFEDDRIQSLVGEALDHNLDLTAAAARLEAAAAEARIAGAGVFPTHRCRAGTPRASSR